MTKAELAKYDQAKDLFESQGTTTWDKVAHKAITELIKENKDKTLEEAATAHVEKLATLFDKGQALNPTASELVIINIAKYETERKLENLKEDIDSNDGKTRINALEKFDKLNNEKNISKSHLLGIN